MATTIKPVFYKTLETDGYIDSLASNIKNAVGSDADLLLDHPAIYIHVWQSKYDTLNGQFSIYIGETNDIVQRTEEHWNKARVPKDKREAGNWQYHMIEDVDIDGNKVIPTVYFFGHLHFHKSLTLDIENRLIDYCYAMPTAHVHNGRTNPQGHYSGDEDLDVIFNFIWKTLRQENSFLFLPESDIKKSAIYKTSPNHVLTNDQKAAKRTIISRTVDAILSNQKNQLIFVEGEAGTGKSVLTNSTFYEILDNNLFKSLDCKCYMLINHMEQYVMLQNMAKRIVSDIDKKKESIIQYPTAFLLNHSVLDKESNSYEPDYDNFADIVFVDEAHLLWNQNNQKYDSRFKHPQLEEIIKRSRVTVVMFDENQILHRGQIYAQDYMMRMRDLARSQGPDPENGESNYIVLNSQLRMNCDSATFEWIDSITKNLVVKPLSLNKKNEDTRGYEVVLFDDPSEMHKAIMDKAKKKETSLSRMVATLDWDFSHTQLPEEAWYVSIGDWCILWNDELFNRYLYFKLNKRQIKRLKMLDWAEKDYSVYETGSTFTIQGFDLSYVGVIIGPSVRYDKENNKIWFDEKYRTQNYMKGFRTMDDGTKINITEIVSKNELRVLMTRGTKGLYIYACDDDLRDALKKSIINRK